MGRDDWYRNKDWSPEIEAAFLAKLGRARLRNQYLVIQAGMLAESHPEVALDLLRRYFELEPDIFRSGAYACRARAQAHVRDIDGALDSYESALAQEEAFPSYLTQAYLDLPILIVRQRREDRYARARVVLERHRARPKFPLEVFRWHAVLALLSEHEGDRAGAITAARAALEAARATSSGFKFHAKLGLVGARDDDLVDEMNRIVAAM